MTAVSQGHLTVQDELDAVKALAEQRGVEGLQLGAYWQAKAERYEQALEQIARLHQLSPLAQGIARAALSARVLRVWRFSAGPAGAGSNTAGGMNIPSSTTVTIKQSMYAPATEAGE